LISNSRIISDTIFHENIRYKIGSRSLRLRRKENIEVKIPVEKDERTEEVEKNEPFPGSVYIDAESFSGCIHVTFETKCLSEARWLYDQISVIATITNALSAATPIISGKLVATDNRWEMNTMGQDDRTPEERDPNHPQYLRKCRHSNVNYYVSELPQMKS
jgi:glutamate--cysteine ligase catalytic subunit